MEFPWAGYGMAGAENEAGVYALVLVGCNLVGNVIPLETCCLALEISGTRQLLLPSRPCQFALFFHWKNEK